MASLRTLRRVAVRAGGTRVVQGDWWIGDRCEQQINSVEAFWEGPQALAVAEVERHEAVQLSEPFGE